uniref:primase-helicase family protein n=1 Tax=Aliarcobacter sp. TaxID=2321116 RepID=UPI0040474C89
MNTAYQIVKKGKENPPFTISRSNKYFKYFLLVLLLGDYDPDKAMPEHMILKTLQDFYNVLCLILPPEFNKVECLIGSGSSNGIKNTNGELVYDSGSMHAYWINSNVNEKNIEKLIEYIKRACILHNFYYLKIFKDGSTGMRFQIDLAVLKSALSRLVFEAKPTCKDGLYQDRPQSLIWNMNSQETLDLSKFFYDHLPDWKPVYEQLKIENRELIEQTKEVYKTSKIEELVNRGIDITVATDMVVKYIGESTLSVKFFVQDEYNIVQIISLLISINEYIYLKDPIEPEKGYMKAYLISNHIFDAEIFSYLHGGKKYKLDFELDDIHIILNYHKEHEQFEKILSALSSYLVESKKTNKFVKIVSEKIYEITKNNELKEYFEHQYDMKYLEDKAFKYLNSYALIRIGGKVGIIDKSSKVLEVISKADAKTLFENKMIKSLFSKKNKNPIDVFIGSKNREEYSEIVFQDIELTKPHQYNLFRGFPFNPIKKVDTSLFWNFVKEVICNNDELMYAITYSWMAQIIQQPFTKIGTALILTGEKGAGKSTFVTIFGSLFGEYFMQTASSKRMFGDFNAHLQNNLLFYANESFWSGDKASEGKLKNFITEIDFTYEIKGSAVYKGKNHSHLILDSNNDFVVPVTNDERRYIILKVSSIYKANDEYFNPLYKLTSIKEFKESLMFDLMNFDFKPCEKYLRKAPKTEASIEQLLHNLDSYEQWFYDVLESGELKNCIYSLDNDFSIRISNEAMHQSFIMFAKDNGKRIHDSTAIFSKTIKKKFLSNELILSETIKSVDGKNAKIIASLDKCRAYFTNKYGIEIKSAITHWQVKTLPTYQQKGY